MDDIDRANNAIQDAMDNALARRQQDDQPGDGICQECGDKINHIRLAALPTAKLCVYCQSEKEKREAQFSGDR